MTTPETASKSGFRWKWLLYLAVVLALVFTGKHFHIQDLLKQALEWVAKLGPWGPVMFTGIYIVAALLLIPGSVLTLGAGALFGLVKGTLVVSVASTVAATCAFLIGRYLARDAIARKIAGNEKFSAVDRAVAAQGWKIVLLTRLSPVFPFTLLNYAFGLTQVRLRHYVLASWIGMLPGSAMFVYLGSLAHVGSGQRVRTPGEWVLYGVGLLATVAVSIFVTRIAKQALARRIERSH